MPETETRDGWFESRWGLPAAEERKLAYAAVMGLGQGEAVSEADVDKVGRWSAQLMRDAALVEMILSGDLLPVDVRPDGEIAVATTDHCLSPELLAVYRVQRERIARRERIEAEKCLPTSENK